MIGPFRDDSQSDDQDTNRAPAGKPFGVDEQAQNAAHVVGDDHDLRLVHMLDAGTHDTQDYNSPRTTSRSAC